MNFASYLKNDFQPLEYDDLEEHMKGFSLQDEDSHLQNDVKIVQSSRKLMCWLFIYTIIVSGIIIASSPAVREHIRNHQHDIIDSIQVIDSIISKSSISYTINIALELPTTNTTLSINSLNMLPWDILVEPHREQILYISSFIIDGESVDISSNDEYRIQWKIGDNSYSGHRIMIKTIQTGMFVSSVLIIPQSGSPYYGRLAKNPDSSKTWKRKLDRTFKPSNYPAVSTSFLLSFHLASKYVRRVRNQNKFTYKRFLNCFSCPQEVRSLNEADRNNYFAAMKVLYSSSDVGGQGLYGSNYHSAGYFSSKYLQSSGTSDCDHINGNAGFLTGHLSLTRGVEKALQSIDPALALPYWDYTKDSDDDELIFSSQWFGEASPSNTHHIISDGGRWNEYVLYFMHVQDYHE